MPDTTREQIDAAFDAARQTALAAITEARNEALNLLQKQRTNEALKTAQEAATAAALAEVERQREEAARSAGNYRDALSSPLDRLRRIERILQNHRLH